MSRKLPLIHGEVSPSVSADRHKDKKKRKKEKRGKTSKKEQRRHKKKSKRYHSSDDEPARRQRHDSSSEDEQHRTDGQRRRRQSTGAESDSDTGTRDDYSRSRKGLDSSRDSSAHRHSMTKWHATSHGRVGRESHSSNYRDNARYRKSETNKKHSAEPGRRKRRDTDSEDEKDRKHKYRRN